MNIERSVKGPIGYYLFLIKRDDNDAWCYKYNKYKYYPLCGDMQWEVIKIMPCRYKF